MKKLDIKGQWALVTGASSGLGAEFARQLASEGCHLILVARRKERLQELSGQLRKDHSVETRVFALDLGVDDAPDRLYQMVRDEGLDVDILINNAGFGAFGYFLDIPWEKEKAMLELDMIRLTHLTKLFGREMRTRGRGHILLVSSIGAFQPTATYSTYSAAKSYVLFLGEALNYELRRHGIRCTTLAPGITATEFLEVSGQKAGLYQRLLMMSSPKVVRLGLNAMRKGTMTVVPGYANAAIAFMTRRLTPSACAVRLSDLAMRLGSNLIGKS